MRPDAGPRVGPGTAAPATSVASGPMAQRLVVIGGGPAGNQAATTAARLGADVTLIERDVLGGAAHLWDCIPSKAMIATGDAMTLLRQAEGMGLRGVDAHLDFDALRTRIDAASAAIDREAALIADEARIGIQSAIGPIVTDNREADPRRGFGSLGEFMQAVYQADRPG